MSEDLPIIMNGDAKTPSGSIYLTCMGLFFITKSSEIYAELKKLFTFRRPRDRT